MYLAAKPPNPVLSNGEGHLAKHHSLALVAQDTLRHPYLQVQILLRKVPEEDVERLFPPLRRGPCSKRVQQVLHRRLQFCVLLPPSEVRVRLSSRCAAVDGGRMHC